MHPNAIKLCAGQHHLLPNQVFSVALLLADGSSKEPMNSFSDCQLADGDLQLGRILLTAVVAHVAQLTLSQACAVSCWTANTHLCMSAEAAEHGA